MGNKQPKDYLFKIFIVGDSGVGKTALLSRFADNTFTESYKATDGVDFKIRTLELDGNNVKLQLWDIAGQQKVPISKWYPEAHGFIICYDVTTAASFHHVRDYLAEIERYQTGKVEKLLVGTKADLVSNRVIDSTKAKAVADSCGMAFIETSAKTDQNVAKAIIRLAVTIQGSGLVPPITAIQESSTATTQVASASAKQCSECEGCKLVAISSCATCGTLLCQRAVEAHKAVRATRTHTLSPIVEHNMPPPYERLDSTKRILLKIILLGESGVGKTSLIVRYVEQRFSPHVKSTIGANFFTKRMQLDDKIAATCQIWDTAGPERFDGLGTAFYRGSDGAIFVFDVANRKSFEELEYWKKAFLNEVGGDSNFPMIVVANRVDLKHLGEVSQKEMNDWCAKHGLQLFETSAKEGAGIDRAFEGVARLVISRMKPEDILYDTVLDDLPSEDTYEYDKALEWAVAQSLEEATAAEKQSRNEKEDVQGVISPPSQLAVALAQPLVVPFSQLQLGPKIGRGGFGIVFQGTWLGTTVAIKRLNADIPRDVVKEFMKEAATMRALAHPNVVLLMGISEDPLCLILEFMAKGTLWHLIHKGNFAEITWPRRMKFLMEAARGMVYLHALNVLHLDLKPHNMMVDANNTLKIEDFGLATIREANAITRSHSTIDAFTLGYAAPEVLTEMKGYPESDVFSFGIVMWELIEGKTPWFRMGNPMILIPRGDRPPVNEGTKRAQAAYTALMQRCWHQRRAERPPFSTILDCLTKIDASQAW